MGVWNYEYRDGEFVVTPAPPEEVLRVQEGDPAPQDCVDWGDPKDVASLVLFEDGADDEPEALECDDCGVEDGARWDVGPNNEWSVCDGCRDTFGYAELVERNRLIKQIKDLLKPMF